MATRRHGGGGVSGATLSTHVLDTAHGVRGGRAPKLALPLTCLLRFVPMVRSNAIGKLALVGGF